MGGGAEEGEDGEDDGNDDDDEEVNAWNLRKSSASSLDTLSNLFPEELQAALLPIVTVRRRLPCRVLPRPPDPHPACAVEAGATRLAAARIRHPRARRRGGGLPRRPGDHGTANCAVHAAFAGRPAAARAQHLLLDARPVLQVALPARRAAAERHAADAAGGAAGRLAQARHGQKQAGAGGRLLRAGGIGGGGGRRAGAQAAAHLAAPDRRAGVGACHRRASLLAARR